MAETTQTYPMQPSDRSMFSSKPETISTNSLPPVHNEPATSNPAPQLPPVVSQPQPVETPKPPNPTPITIL
jgi:hypothetical protein